MPKLILSSWFPFKPFVGACPSKNLIVIRRDWWEQATPHAKLQAVTHELAHVKQRRSDPWFNLKYAWNLLKHGYENNPFEQQARALETSPTLQTQARNLIERSTK